jgi:ankyrin repeat protein
MSVTALQHAIQGRDLKAAQAVLERDASQALEALPGGLSPLMFALYNGAHDIATLLRAFSEPNLFEAAALGDARETARLALAETDAVERFSVDGWTALHLAAFFGARDAAFVLLGLGASLRAISRNPMANTPLHAAVAGASGDTLAPLLVAFGADVTQVGGDGITPLHLAAARGFEALSRLLVARGARTDVRAADGKTAADLAAERGHAALAAWLRGGSEPA